MIQVIIARAWWGWRRSRAVTELGSRPGASRHSEPGLDERKPAYPSESTLRPANMQHPGRPQTTVRSYPSPFRVHKPRAGPARMRFWGHAVTHCVPRHRPRQTVTRAVTDRCGCRKDPDAAAIAPLYLPPNFRSPTSAPLPCPTCPRTSLLSMRPLAAWGSETGGNSLTASRPRIERRRGRLSVPRAEGAA